MDLHDNPTQFLSTVQIGITLVGIVAGAYSGTTLSEPLAAVIATTASGGWSSFVDVLTGPQTFAAVKLTVLTSLQVTVLNEAGTTVVLSSHLIDEVLFALQREAPLASSVRVGWPSLLSRISPYTLPSMPP